MPDLLQATESVASTKAAPRRTAAAPRTPVSCALAAPLLEPDSPDVSLTEEHAWRIRVSTQIIKILTSSGRPHFL